MFVKLKIKWTTSKNTNRPFSGNFKMPVGVCFNEHMKAEIF